MKIIIAIAVVIGLVVGIGFAVLTNGRSSDAGSSAAASSKSDEIDPAKLPAEVLKALPPEQLAEMFPEKAEAILNPELAEQINAGGKSSDDPKYLRAVLEKMGANPPADATTKQLQDMLAHASAESAPSGK